MSIDYDDKTIAPLASFQELLSLGVDSWLVEAIEQLGWTTPTPIQAHLLPVWLNSERVPDILARAPTGSGKTAAYVVPVLHHLHRLLSDESAAPTKSKGTDNSTKNNSTKNSNTNNNTKNNNTKNNTPNTPNTKSPTSPSSIRALILAPTRELTQQISHLAAQLLQHAPREISVHVLGKSISPDLRPRKYMTRDVITIFGTDPWCHQSC